MLSQFKKHIESSFGFLADAKLLVTVSGGIDSVVLAHLCSKLGLNYAIAHCNFGLRNGESDEDEDFVISLAEDLNVEVFIENFDTQDYADTHKLSIQMAARELRYNWFQELANHLKFDYILTAHNADDNLETFLINFTRGTGLNGLTGIPAINDNVARPLLNFSRAHITAFAEKERIKWREDSSNSTTKYLRNKLRHEVIPVLKEINPQLLDSLKNTLTNLQDTAD
ncbi:MAG: tRNA lysidine(34) synthetase TilS, partial [Winogradskyella sp.]|nr:tRNA lysidine(34) synthetase TilS [Winogradskyella sp.]